VKDWKDNVSFIIIEPKEPGNVGAAARAMKNMGFTRLELVAPAPLTDEARWMACTAVDLLDKAKIHAKFQDAIQDKGLVIGTTRRIGKRRGLILPVKEGVKKAVAFAGKNRIGILFGREDKGLRNNEVGECGFLMTIPANPAFPSINLAQSVLLVAYELGEKAYGKGLPEFADRKEIEMLYRHMQRTLKLLGYIPRGSRDMEERIMNNLKRLIGRAGLTDWELRMLRGICSQAEKKLGHEDKGQASGFSR